MTSADALDEADRIESVAHFLAMALPYMEVWDDKAAEGLAMILLDISQRAKMIPNLMRSDLGHQ